MKIKLNSGFQVTEMYHLCDTFPELANVELTATMAVVPVDRLADLLKCIDEQSGIYADNLADRGLDREYRSVQRGRKQALSSVRRHVVKAMS